MKNENISEATRRAWARRRNNIIGRVFGKWTVMKEGGRNRQGSVLWLCRCECGRQQEVVVTNLLKGRSKGCRTCRVKEARCTHGPNSQWYKQQVLEAKLLLAIELIEQHHPEWLNPCQDTTTIKASLNQPIPTNTSALDQLFGVPVGNER